MKENIFFKKEPISPKNGRQETQETQETEKTTLEGLREKVDVIKRIKNLVDETRIDEKPESVNQRFSDYIGQIFNKYPQAAEKVKERERIREELASIDKKSKKLNEEWKNLAIKINELSQILEGKIPKDVEFLESIKNGTNLLIKKFHFVQEIRNNQERLLEELNLAIFPELEFEDEKVRKIDRDKLKEIIFNPFGITVVIEKKYFEEEIEKKNLLGFHRPGSVFCIVTEEDRHLLTETIEHENIHNILDGFLPLGLLPSKLFQMRFEIIDDLRQKNVPPALIKIAKETRGEILKTSASKIIDMLHEEILADIYLLERLLDEKISTDRVEQDEFSKFLAKIVHQEPKEHQIGVFSTVRKEIDEIRDILTEAKIREIDPEINTHCTRLFMTIRKAFNRAISFANKALCFSRYTKDALEIHSLLSLLKPSKFYHLDDYLRYHYGDRLYDGLITLYKLFLFDDFSLETLKTITNIKNEIPEREIGHLKHRLENIENFAAFIKETNLKSASLEELRKYFRIIESLNSRLQIETKKIANFKEYTLWQFFHFYFCESLKNNFKTFDELVPKLSPPERSVFENVLENYFGDVYIYEDLKELLGEKAYQELYEKSGYDFVKSLPLWRELVKLNLDQVAQQGLSRLAEKISLHYFKTSKDT